MDNLRHYIDLVEGNWKRAEMKSELGNEASNNYGVVIGDSKSFWKVFGSKAQADRVVAALKGKGKDAVAIQTAAPVTK
jgi:hypothetical protein